MATLTLGTAHLYGLLGETESDCLLAAAYDTGVRRFDTAPSYGHGHSESRVGALVGRYPDLEMLSTKTGVVVPAGPHRARELAKQAARALPGFVTQRLRNRSRESQRGHFTPAEARASIDQSLARLGRVDRLLLHEVRPPDITPELVDLLESYRRSGDVGQIGVATSNDETLACLALAPETFDVAHTSVGPMDLLVELPAHVTARVGHGVFGGGGVQLQEMQRALNVDAALQERWEAATADTEYAGASGLAAALLVRAAWGMSDDIIFATSQPDRLKQALRLVTESAPLPPPVAAALVEIATSASATWNPARPSVDVASSS